MDDLDKMLAEYASKGGMVTVLPATKYEETVGDGLRLKDWGFPDMKKRKNVESYKDQIAFELGGKRDDE
tara:strand:- start:621 stop:827 length:207 start_codon:yes stop_codon:yes gene_type:complete